MSDSNDQSTTVSLGGKKSAPGYPVRFSYLTIEKPKLPQKPKPGDLPKFSVQIIVDKKSPDVERINAAMRAAAKASKSTAGVDYDTLDLILRDGDNPKENKKKAPHLFGKFFLNASANADYPPDVVGRFKDPNTDKLERLVSVNDDDVRQIRRGADGQPKIKSGDFGAVSVNFYGYSANGNTGVAAGLRNIQKLADGESLAGLSSADDDFDAEEAEDDEFMK